MPICVLGMHRSGTSLLMQMLGKCGVYLGEDERVSTTGDHDNPMGYWENLSFRKINDGLLSSLGGDWKSPPAMRGGWAQDDRIAPLRARARTLAARHAEHGLWGWKDPRNSLTIPFWQDVVPDLKFVIMVRNPVQVAVSLQARIDQGPPRSQYGLEFDDALALWGTYHDRILESLGPDHGFPVVHYEALLHRPLVELIRISEALDLPFDRARMERAAELPDRGLFRSQASPDQLGKLQASSLRFAYEDLCRAAGPNFHALQADQLHKAAVAGPDPGASGTDVSAQDQRHPDRSTQEASRAAPDLEQLDIVVVHYLQVRATVAMLTALFRHYPEANVTVVDNSGGAAPFKTRVLPHLIDFKDRIRLIVNPATEHGKYSELSHGGGIDLARRCCTRPYLLSMETDTFVLERGCIEHALSYMARGHDWAGNAQKPIDGRFASFSPSFAIFRVSVLDQYDLSFRPRQRSEQELEREDPLIRHHRQAAKLIEAGGPVEYPQGKPPDTYRRSTERIVAAELQHLTYYDTGEWVHSFLTDKGYRGVLFELPPSVRHTWGSRDEGVFVRNFRETLPGMDLNSFLPPALRFASKLEPLGLKCLDLVDRNSLAPAAHWRWAAGPPGALQAQGNALKLSREEDTEKVYLVMGAGGFDRPPPEKLDADLAPSSLHRLCCDCRIMGAIRASIWLIEYDGNTRIHTHQAALNEGRNEVDFITNERTNRFRLAFRISGTGSVILSRLRLMGG